MKTFLHLLSLLCLLLVFSACSESDAPPLAPRTLLVYLAGDNNLSDETYAKLEAIARGWDGEAGHLIVYQDSRSELPRLIELKKDGKFSTVCSYAQERNSCSAAFFAEAIGEVTARYPARDYGLLFFSHATGWLPRGNYPTPQLRTPTRLDTRTIGKDGTDEMPLDEFAAAIPDGQFRFIVFEACLMAGAEVAYALKDKTQTLVASSAEILSPGFTDLYPRMIPLLFAPEPRLTELATLYYDHWNGKKGFHRSATISVVRSAGMERLAQLAQQAMQSGRAVTPTEVTSFDSGTAQLYCDLGEYLALKCGDTDPALRAAIAAQLAQTVVYRAATPEVMGTPCGSHSGLTVYLPRSGYDKLNTYYRLTSWARSVNPPDESPSTQTVSN